MKNTTVFEHKVVSRSFQEPVAGIITRALETMDKTCLRTSACVPERGLLIFMKGPSVDPEIKEVQRRFGDKYRLSMDESYVLPYTKHERRLVVLERLAPVELPKELEEPSDD